MLPLISLLLITNGEAASDPRRPNVIFLLADDLGWMDTTPYGSEYYRTPNIEKLAARGMLFTNAYAANPLCSPTRASIIAGKYPGRLRMTRPEGHLPVDPDEVLLPETREPYKRVIDPNNTRFLDPAEYTLAEAFRDAGYRTGFIGKWHLGHAPEHWSSSAGFEQNVGGGGEPGPPSYFSPYGIKNLEDGPEGEYITDRLSEEADRFIRAHKDEPFFLCYWHYAVHDPFEGKKELVRKYRDVIDPRGAQANPTMAAMIESFDESVGRLLETLEREGLADNTILVFFSDNGGNMYDEVNGVTPTNNAPLRNGKGNLFEGGVRVPMIVIWPGKIAADTRSGAFFSSVDFYPTLLSLAGLALPEQQLLDGIDQADVLLGRKDSAREEIFCHFPHYLGRPENLPGVSVRRGDWKLVRRWGEGPDGGVRHELYNLKSDIGERANVAAQNPELVKELDRAIDRHLAETDAIIPPPNPAYDPKAKDPFKAVREELAAEIVPADPR